MCLGRTDDFGAGDSVTLTLILEYSGEITFDVDIKE
jgi:hypothetical protein